MLLHPAGSSMWVGKSVVFGDGLTKPLQKGWELTARLHLDLSLTSGTSVPNGSALVNR